MPFRVVTLALACGLITTLQGQDTWRRTYGGFDSNIGRSVRQTSDGGFLLVGSTGSFGGGGGDIYVIKTDAAGTPIWSRTIGDAGVQTGVAGREVGDGYLIAGTTTTGAHGGYDMLLCKLDVDGGESWQLTYGTADWDLCADMEAGSAAAYLVGTSFGANGSSAVVYKVDLNGNPQWTASVDGPFDDAANGVSLLADEGVLVSGTKGISAGDQDALIMRFDGNGTELWSRTFGGPEEDRFYDAVELSNGRVVCSGGTRSYSDVLQILAVSVLADGSDDWQREFGSMGDSEGREIQVDLMGNLAIASFNSYANAGGRDMVLFKITAGGDFLLGKNYGGIDDEEGFSLDCISDGGYVLVGTAEGYGPGIRSIYVVRSNEQGETDDDTVYEMFDALVIRGEADASVGLIYPNPATTHATLRNGSNVREARLFDTAGRSVRAWPDGNGPDFDLSGIPAGVYRLTAILSDHSRFSAPLLIHRP